MILLLLQMTVVSIPYAADLKTTEHFGIENRYSLVLKTRIAILSH